MKTAAFIPVRINSTRLPGKALLEIKGRPILEYLIERVKSARTPDLVVLCTTTNTEDEVLVKLARKNGIRSFQGSEKDILERYLQAAAYFHVDFIANVDGDDIFCDADYIDRVAQAFLKTSADYIKCEGLPFGAAPTGIKVAALRKVCELKNASDTETGWGRYFTESGLFRIESIAADADVRHPEIRMTLDYPEDFQFFEAVIKNLYVPGKVFSLRKILSLLKSHPEIAGLNRQRQDEYWETFNKKAAKIEWK